ncbi:MAG TPA: V-type ATPase subunit [Methanoregulaceae archaeon]|nr:V-type ATPase subunit [Methanoregulaceae archaeon]
MYVEYVNARVHGMAGRLIDRHEFERLIAQTSVDGVITELEKTSYHDDILEARVLHKGINCIEYALRTNLARTFRKIHDLTEGEKSARYITLILKRWDIQNIKTILRGKNIQASNEEIARCLIHAGTMDESTLIELLKQRDVRSAIDLMATWNIEYSVPLTRYIGEFSEQRNLWKLEYALDEYYYRSALENLAKGNREDRVVLDFLKTEIDAMNVKNILILLRDSVPPEEGEKILLDGGKVFDRKHLLEMINAQGISDLLQRLGKTEYAFLMNVNPENIRAGKISAIEKEIERFLIRKGIAMFRGDPLSFTIVIGFLWSKLNEITNIRVIARARDAGLPDDVMEAEIFYV